MGPVGVVKIALYGSKGEAREEVAFEIKDRKVKSPTLLWEVLRYYNAVQRKPYAATKTRGEKRGGGRKPWRQKGTGRARHGSRRSPIWRGGGVTFGPRTEKKYQIKMNKKQLRRAFRDVFLSKAAEGGIKLITEISKLDKTKKAAELFNNILGDGKPKKNKIFSILFVYHPEEKDIKRVVRNLPKTEAISGDQVNSQDLLRKKYVLITKKAFPFIKKRLEK